MKYTLVVNQIGAVNAGLIGKVCTDDLCLLDYLAGWAFSPKTERVNLNERTFYWVDYANACEELPLIFNPAAQKATLKNQLSKMIQRLRDFGLLETARHRKRLYFRLTERGVSLTTRHAPRGSTRKSHSVVTQPHDKTVMPVHDEIIMSKHDDPSAPIIDETGNQETNIKESSPHSPPLGEFLSPGSSSFSAEVEKIYMAYPRQVDRPAALPAICRAIEKHGAAFVLERTTLYARTVNLPLEFIPFPVRFFREERYKNDPATWLRSGPVPTGRQSKPSPQREFNRSDYHQPVTNF